MYEEIEKKVRELAPQYDYEVTKFKLFQHPTIVCYGTCTPTLALSIHFQRGDYKPKMGRFFQITLTAEELEKQVLSAVGAFMSLANEEEELVEA